MGFSVRISSHNPFTNFGVTVGGPTMKFADLRAKAKPKACRKVAGSSSSSGGSSPGLDDSLQDMMDHSPGKTIDKKGDKLYHKGKTVKRSEKPVPSIKSPSSPES